MEKIVIAVVATKNRVEFLEKALYSISIQVKKPDRVIIVSDSVFENYQEEVVLAQKYNYEIIQDAYESNYAGSLNTAIDSILHNWITHRSFNLSNTYIAFLDDDDTWNNTYIEKCLESLNNNDDFVVSGLNYITETKNFPLNIPTKLNKNSFLATNPHIQGSNTFIKLSTILKAGCFDENLSSTTDRDFFTRVMMLNPKYSIIKEHLVTVNAFNNRERLTNSSEGKNISLKKFFSKYSGIMNPELKNRFFERASRYTELSEMKIEMDYSNKEESTVLEYRSGPFSRRIVFGVIISDLELGARLIRDIAAQVYRNIKLIVFANVDDVNLLESLIEENCIEEFYIITNNQVRNTEFNPYINEFIRSKTLKDTIIKDIAVSRTILNHFLKKETLDDDVIWILDDDMKLSYLVKESDVFVEKKLDIASICGHFENTADVVIGSYSGDAPLPTISTLRTSLLDFTYKNVLKKTKLFDRKLGCNRDYYYDLTDTNHLHLETPQFSNHSSLDDIFSGKAYSRPLYVKENNIYEPYTRGGNTIIYNREVLDIPNMSIVFGKYVARRGDFFWVKLLQDIGYKVIGSSFSTYHDRKWQKFDYDKETDKSLKDLIGSAFIKAYSELEGNSRSKFREKFLEKFDRRLVRFVSSYYRIIGLLEINKSVTKYGFNEINLADYLRKAKQLQEEALIESSYDYLMSLVEHYKSSKKVSGIKKIIVNIIDNKLNFIGHGNEGVVFHDENYIYKVFFCYTDLNELKKQSTIFGDCDQLEKLECVQREEIQYIKYKYYKNCREYKGGFALEIANLIGFLKENNLVLTNIKRSNFLICDGILKFIDYGKNIEPYTLEMYDMSVKRAYQMLKYPFLSISEYKHVISLSHKGMDNNINFGIDSFTKLIQKRSKEDIHDYIVKNLISKYSPNSLLDYGAGKCKIVNQLSTDIDVLVYDVDQDILIERANSRVQILNDPKQLDEKVDMVVSNLVLCSVDDQIQKEIMKNIYNSLKMNKEAVISFCNPFFTDVNSTELRTSGREFDYCISDGFNKKTKYGIRKEIHRTLNHYTNMFRRNGFDIVEIIQSDGVSIENLEPISEFMYFVLRKRPLNRLDECSLLIKCNSMDYKTIEDDITHIVSTLEYGVQFAERVVIVDKETKDRNRRFDVDCIESLKISLRNLLHSGLIDRVVYAEDIDSSKTYMKWFGVDCLNEYAKNGQQLKTSLVGFDEIKTRYVFQTDIDIIYSNRNAKFYNAFADFKESKAVTGTLSIYRSENSDMKYDKRTEVRSCFLDLRKLNGIIPLKNIVEGSTFKLPWHRSIDICLNKWDSVRFVDSELFFTHPENDKKRDSRLLSLVREKMKKGNGIPDIQHNEVNLKGNIDDWVSKLFDDVIVYVRGHNTNPSKLLRMFTSLKKQSFQDFKVVLIDDCSIKQVQEYIESVVAFDAWAKEHIYAIQNTRNVGTANNFEFAMKHVIKNPNAIVIHLDSDDAFIRDDAIQLIQNEYSKGADVTLGNCLRYDKPLKNYRIESFKNLWDREGDNVWLHPKSHRHYLSNYVQDDLLRNGKYIQVCTDYAFTLPILEHSVNPVFINEQIYFFQPSIENVLKEDKYAKENTTEMMKFLLRRAKENNMKKIIAVIGNGNIQPDDERYKIAIGLGKALVDNGFRVQTGGLGGIMEASLKGAKLSDKYAKGDTIAILPSLNKEDANEYADVIIPTGLDIMRNAKVVEADAVIAIGGGSGTLSEMAIAWQKYKLIIAFDNVDGWSKELSNRVIDDRVRYKDIPNDKVYGVSSTKEALKVLEENVNLYIRVHKKIKWRKDK